MSDTKNMRPIKEAQNKDIRERKKYKYAVQQDEPFNLDEIKKEVMK